MNNLDKNDDCFQVTSKLIGEKKYREAIGFLQKIIETDNKNKKAIALLEHLKKIMEYQNRDIFGSTNLDMDPWLE
ncbi:MAG TPA: hypothetical protein PKI34_08510 [Bacteroidales bacterium]|nr:hypothetical protein [Bacteroidales bacterium]